MRCTAKIAYGSAWDAGRKQCSNTAIEGEELCATHKRVKLRREARNRKDA